MSNVPAELSYTSEHEWVSALTAEGTVRVGITDHAQDALGDVVYVDLPSVGDSVAAEDSFGEIESTKSVSDLFAPIAGEIVAVNEGLEDDPALVNSDPYGEGWIIEIRPENADDLANLLDAEAYKAELDKL
ncbi:glycine cleavage system protein GcvH [Rothia mucilaginosa]|jgi:glycine cleavage system H protein|uniref:Glycine cleavage system H protein n=3 Tax=Rothia mucilaginosa TaxID=43675 RepID=A0A0K2RXX8_9MICC|nr:MULTISPECIES: glycine cleavage system protein GcvH [Rothia]MBF1678101.1 glycine cleavage system protein GcvH [Rothia sp. (in: high G+C Gram-positive bacteria)]MBF1656642.1 glycine cleavage system protein GcvH [Rothia mucilaginosa]OFJ75128.1 glycine cleavage system protein H [Rothia sp. HMSC065B04]OFL53612.1 glycine cleavage system protein H [Rothia sp. HMSC062H08]OFO20297.1 glycine cleavage system protein H [Rothia sp. HMSC061C12]